jgi:hypothetical protein
MCFISIKMHVIYICVCVCVCVCVRVCEYSVVVALPGLCGGSGMLQFGITAKSELSSGIAQAG